jgi:hypothetical protein
MPIRNEWKRDIFLCEKKTLHIELRQLALYHQRLKKKTGVRVVQKKEKKRKWQQYRHGEDDILVRWTVPKD